MLRGLAFIVTELVVGLKLQGGDHKRGDVRDATFDYRIDLVTYLPLPLVYVGQ